MRYEQREITVPSVAHRLMVSERHAESLLKDRLIAGRQLRSGQWLTNEEAVDRYLAIGQRGRGRTLNASTAWGVLWDLSGLRPDWLSSSTLMRVRERIAASTPEEIVRATSGRTRARYYTIAASGGKKNPSWDGLVRSARPAARRFGVRSLNYASGYICDGAREEFTRRYALFEDYEGMNVLFDNTLPITYKKATMPDAVVAVDLTLTGGEFERKRGIAAIAHLQRVWTEARERA